LNADSSGAVRVRSGNLGVPSCSLVARAGLHGHCPV